MSSELSARQADGGAGRQKQDAPAAIRDFAFPSAFFDSNLERLALLPVTREAVLLATRSAELVSGRDGDPLLLREDKVLGGAPDEDELRLALAQAGELVYVVFGLGLGHGARALRALTDAPILIYEPDPGLLRSVLELGPTDLSGFDIVCNTHDLTQIWPQFTAGRRSALVVPSAGYLDVFAAQAADLRATLAELVQRSRINDATHRLRAREWISDVLANVELLCEHPGFLALAGKYRGVPAFIVGAGPSLGKNIHLLEEAKKKGIVFAVNTSARALAQQGTAPHVLACMESIDVSQLLSDIGFLDEVARAFSLSAHPRTLRTGRGPLLPLYEGVPQIAGPLQELTGMPGLPVSGSVSTLAFALAQRLGCSPIVFVGQDLAYTGGHAYASGTPYAESRVERSVDGREIRMLWCDTLKRTHNVDGRKMHESEPLNEVTAWGGSGTVLTSIGFSAVRAWLEAAATVMARETRDTQLINATEGGARIEGFEELRLETLLTELPARDLSARGIADAARAAAQPISRQRVAQWAASQRRAVTEARHAARRVRRLAELARDSTRSGNGNTHQRLLRLEQAERALSQRVAAAPLLDAWSWSVVDQLMQDQPSEDINDPRRSAERSLSLETRLGAAIERCARELERELEALGQRLSQPANFQTDSASGNPSHNSATPDLGGSPSS